MLMLDASVLNVAIPALSTALPASLDQVLWVINAYTITWAALLITAGRLGYRRRELVPDPSSAFCEFGGVSVGERHPARTNARTAWERLERMLGSMDS